MEKRRFQGLNYAGVFPRISDEELYETIRTRDEAKLQNGEGEKNYALAINKIVESNLRLLISQAKVYSKRYSVSLEDAISEGAIALIAAAESYDPLRGKKFSSYAVGCMKRHFIVKLPYYVNSVLLLKQGQRRQLSFLYKQLNSSFENEQKNLENSAAAIGISPFKASRLLQAEKSKNTYIGKQEAGRRSYFGARGSDELYPAEIAEARESKENIKNHLRRALSDLKDKEFEIISMHFGLAGERLTLDQIGKTCGVTRERIRQIEKKAIGKLRKRLPSDLADYFTDK